MSGSTLKFDNQSQSSGFGFSADGTSKSSSHYDDGLSSDMKSSLNASSVNDLGEMIEDLENQEGMDEETTEYLTDLQEDEARNKFLTATWRLEQKSKRNIKTKAYGHFL